MHVDRMFDRDLDAYQTRLLIAEMEAIENQEEADAIAKEEYLSKENVSEFFSCLQQGQQDEIAAMLKAKNYSLVGFWLETELIYLARTDALAQIENSPH